MKLYLEYRVRVKLEGREPDALRRSTVGEQVDFVIREAQVIIMLREDKNYNHSDDGEFMALTRLSPER